MPKTLRETSKSLVNRLLGPLGLEVRRRQNPPPPPPVIADPVEAMSRVRAGDRVALECPLTQCVVYNGLSFGPEAWHPFVALLKERASRTGHRYEGSVLERYYAAWQPANGREALLVAPDGPRLLERYSALLMHVPWMELSPDERLAFTRRVIEIENSCFGQKGLGVEHGYSLHGPVSAVKGALEYQRLVELLESIQVGGYDRTRGDITAQVLKRGPEYRFRILHGQHRVAVLAHLGYRNVAVVPQMLVLPEEVEHWPQVHRGVWNTDEALRYFNHHFDFDSHGWATRLGLAN